MNKKIKRLRNEILHNYNLITSPPKHMPFSKAFVIGMPKTGTSSVRDFLKLHGSRHLTIFHPVTARWQSGDYEYMDRCIAHYNSFDDRPWNKKDIIERLMQRDEDDHFIMTTRDPDAWFDSRNRYGLKFGYEPTPESQRAKKIQDVFLSHYGFCRNLAEKFNKRIIEIDVTKDSNYGERISNFLGLKDKGVNFPHSNKNTQFKSPTSETV